jgi:Z1 domain-containing protein/type III restriction/modification enzyme restriction subunit
MKSGRLSRRNIMSDKAGIANPDFSEALKKLLIEQLMSVESLQHEQVVELAQKYAPAFGLSKEEIVAVVNYVHSRLVTTMSEGVSLINQDVDHDEDWYLNEDGLSWNYWSDYEQHMITEDWHPRVVNTLGEVTGKILGLLKNPNDPGEWDRRGLVIGHVQSGKTANYIGLITKAADAGYKFIIVIAGIHNNLRKQTQQRIDEGFVGRDSTPGSMRKYVGVGLLNKNRKFPVSLTTTYQDFTKQVATGIVADLQGFNQPVIVVIKKNVTTLSNLYSWLKDWNTRESSQQIANVPMLIIDDEADNASINTNKPDLDPTRTNKEIRRILKLFKKRCYVGYTATPFANIFINPDSADEMLNDDLFPRDFIYCLEAPTNYFGAQRVFADEERSGVILRSIVDAENYFPLTHKTKDFQVDDIPPSLRKALHIFIIGKAIRILRGQENKHTSMMVNLSRFVGVQRQIKEIMSFYIETLARFVRYNHSLPITEALKNDGMRDLKDAYDDEFADLEEKWPEVQKVLSRSIDAIRVYVVNSKSDEALDYKKSEDNEESLTALAIGGLSLSRGLTLEGLMVSYMYRNTKMYDTLMQMGRWFGYREGYEDLCKVYLSEESQGWYEHISEATEELRHIIIQMRRDKMNPKQFGLYVRAHPDALTVTALNKMRDTETRPLRISLNGALIETHIVAAAEEITALNQALIRELFALLETNATQARKKLDGAIFWESVGWEFIDDFLFKYRFHRVQQSSKISARDYLRQISDKYPFVDIAFISLKKEVSGQSRFDLSDTEYMLCQERTVWSSLVRDGSASEPRSPVEEGGYYVSSKQRVASRGSEIVGLSQTQITEAENRAKEDKVNIADRHYRYVRRRPLLMLHLLNLVHKPDESGLPIKLLDAVPAVGIAFPGGDYTTTVEYVVNKVWLNQMNQDSFDNPDEEEDFDF